MDTTLSSGLGRLVSVDPATGEITDAGDTAPPVEAGVAAPFLRTPYNYDTNAASVASGLSCLDPSLAQQQFRDEVDINTIVRNFGLTGQLPEQGAYPAYGDFETVIDYHTAQNVVRASDEAFMTLPAPVRSRFGNDPQQLLTFCADPANLEEARKLGLTRTLSTPPTKPANPTPPPQVGVPSAPGTVRPDGTLTPGNNA